MDQLPPLFAPGQRLGRYELLQRLAVGGMAEVYLAAVEGPGDFRKLVVIKRLLPQHVLDPQLLRMFLDEARLMARLSHPSIPQVTDVDDGSSDAGRVPYFVMEYVHGTDLRGVLNAASAPLPIEQALAITGAVAAGLHHAHEHRNDQGQPLEIVHRDVSPSNVLIGFAGAVKVTDFGIAKWAEQKSFTLQGQLKGKFAHMSPEQCRGEALDRRSDVFALGTLLYEMTTGRAPFVAESEYELLTQIVSRDVSPPRRGGEIYPAQLQQIVLKSLRRQRDERYGSTQELQLALEAFAREHRLVVSPVSLAAYLEELFGARVTEWKQALASGKTLADHLLRSSSAQSPDWQRDGRTAPAGERTATDAFAAAPAAGDASGGAPPPAKRSAGVSRALVIGAGTAAAFAALLVATELTSRWQRASQATSSSGVSRLGVADGLAPTLGPNRVIPATRQSRTAPQPAAAPDAVPLQPVVVAAPGAGGGGPMRTVRRGREGSGGERSVRRGSNALATGERRPVIDRPVVDRTSPSPAATSMQAARPTRARAGTPESDEALPPPGHIVGPAIGPASDAPPPESRATATPQVKVWDPDSPVPP